MLPSGPIRLATGIACSLLLLPLARANDQPIELQQAQAQFQKEMDFALRPMRERYAVRLQTLKRTLISKGDLRGAVAVQDEIDLIVATINEAAFLAKFVGTWNGQFQDIPRRYAVRSDGRVDWLHQDNTLNISGRLSRVGKDFVFTWETFDEVNRVSLTETGGMMMDIFAPKTTFPHGPATLRVLLSRSASNR